MKKQAIPVRCVYGQAGELETLVRESFRRYIQRTLAGESA